MSSQRTSAYLLAGCLTVSLFAGSAQAQGFAQGAVAVTVNGEKIYVADVEKLLKRDTPPPQPLTAKQKQEMWQLAVDMLINDTLMRQFLAKSTPAVTPAQLGKEMDILNDSLKKQNMSLPQYLKESDQTEKDLKEEMTVRIQWKAYVTQRLPDAMVKKYYDDNKVFFDKVFVRASHILLKVPEKSTPQQKAAVKDNIMKIRQDILDKKITFEEAAEKYSDCPSGKAKDAMGKKKGGDIGHFPYKFAVAESFAAAAFALQPGQMSEPIETEFGYHIIKVTERTKGETNYKYEDIIDSVRDVYAQDVQLFQSVVTEQRKTATIVPPVQPNKY